MFSFNAHFYHNKIYLDGRFACNNNETLTEILNLDIKQDLLRLREHFLTNSSLIKVYGDMETEEVKSYNLKVHRAQQYMCMVDELFKSLSISGFIASTEKLEAQKLFDLLNEHSWCFGQEETVYDFDYYDGKEYLLKFVPDTIGGFNDHPDLAEGLERLNTAISMLFTRYLNFIDDILRVKHLYTDFVDNYLHSNYKFLDSDSLAKTFISFIEKTKAPLGANYLNFTSGYSKFFHTVITTGKTSILCESYEFKSLGAFLYFDFFRGVYSNYIPKRCENCGDYFLIKSGKYSGYCEKTSPQDKTKTCREVGARKRYDDKCKTDPVWQTYNRAYKTHYARYMKKKMTVAEFEKWSTWAVEWRTKAENDEVGFEEYVREIRR